MNCVFWYQIIFLKLDLSDFQSVHQFAKEFTALALPLDGLVNNAGLMTEKRMTAEVIIIIIIILPF